MKNQYNLNMAINHFYAGSDIEIIVDWHFSYAPKDEDEIGEKPKKMYLPASQHIAETLSVLVIFMALIFFYTEKFWVVFFLS